VWASGGEGKGFSPSEKGIAGFKVGGRSKGDTSFLRLKRKAFKRKEKKELTKKD